MGVDSYSAFGARPTAECEGEDTGLHDQLKSAYVYDVSVCGIAVEYCVHETTVAALERGYKVTVLKDLCCSLNPGVTDTNAFEVMLLAGATLCSKTDELEEGEIAEEEDH